MIIIIIIATAVIKLYLEEEDLDNFFIYLHKKIFLATTAVAAINQ